MPDVELPDHDNGNVLSNSVNDTPPPSTTAVALYRPFVEIEDVLRGTFSSAIAPAHLHLEQLATGSPERCVLNVRREDTMRDIVRAFFLLQLLQGMTLVVSGGYSEACEFVVVTPPRHEYSPAITFSAAWVR